MIGHIPDLNSALILRDMMSLPQDHNEEEQPLSEEMMRILWMTGTTALKFLVFVGIAKILWCVLLVVTGVLHFLVWSSS